MSDRNRQLIIKIEAAGDISIDILSKKLQAAQKLLLNVGSAMEGGGRRGAWRTEVVQACSLVFRKAVSGSLTIVSELPPPSKLFEGDDLGVLALQRLGNTLEVVAKKDIKQLRKIYGDSGQRARIVNSILPLSPEEDSEYQVNLQINGKPVILNSRFRDSISTLIREDTLEIPEAAIRKLTGILYLIEVQSGQLRVGLIVQNRHIECHYSPDYENVIRDLIPGSLVEVEGRATLNDRGDVARIEQIMDITSVEPIIPLRWTKVDYGNRRFILNEAIQIQQSFIDDVWVCDFSPLEILTYGPSRHEAVCSFREQFAADWDEIANEKDSKLTLDAQQLKKKFIELVKEVENIE